MSAAAKKRVLKANSGRNKGNLNGATQHDVEVMDISDLLPDDKNARKHTPRNVGMIVKALNEVGTGRSGVIDEKGKVLAGNATLEALAEAGIRRIKVVKSSGEEWVVVQRQGLTEKQKKKLALYDNRTAELSMWDTDVLASFKDDNILNDLFFEYELVQLGFPYDSDDPNAQWKGMPEFHQENKDAWRSIVVHFKNIEDLKTFAKLVKQPEITEKTKSIWFPREERINNRDKLYVSES